MCSVTRSITDFFCGEDSIADRLRKIATPCLPAKGNKKVSVRIFDKKSLIGDVTSSVEAVRKTLETFLNDLHKTEGLPSAVAQNLQAFTFEVTFTPRDSSADERRGFGMMDFPVYLETTEGTTLTRPFTEGDGKDLLLAHAIPEETDVRKILSDSGVQTTRVHSYEEVKSFIKDDDQKDLGIAIPGTYFRPNSQSLCRRVAVIKINLIKRNLVLDLRQPKFISVMKHELGHMFGMDHETGTVMDPSNRDAMNHLGYEVNQLTVLNEVLTTISR
jgi:hypothetical protein